MNLEDKKKIIEKEIDKDYTCISPRAIRGGAKLIKSNSSLEKYESMESNTKKLSEKLILDLVTEAKRDNSEKEKLFGLNLIYCGGFNEVRGHLGNFEDFVLDNKDKIVAMYRYVNGTETRHFFVGIPQTDTFNTYDYIYIKLDQLLNIFEENDIKFKIDIAASFDYNIPSSCIDDDETKFKISYNPIKKVEDSNPKLVKKLN